MRISVLFVTIGVSAALVSCQPAGEETADPVETGSEAVAEEEGPDDVALMEAALDEYEDVWSRGDAAGIAGFFAEDGDYVSPAGERHTGRDAIESYYQGLFEGAYAGSTISVAMTNFRRVEDHVAIVDGTYTITGVRGGDGEELPPIEGRYMNVSVKQGGEWKMHCSRPMIPADAPGT